METINHPATVVKDLQLTATLPKDMVDAQRDLLDWCEKKIVACQLEVDELTEAVDHAKKHKWKVSTLQNQLNKAEKRKQYYIKVNSALVAGYYIVPNFPVQMFAIRTTRRNPSGHEWSYWGDHQQNAEQLNQGEGEYRNPFPLVEREDRVTDNSGKEIARASSYPVEWDEFEFPVTMAKPLIMQATTRAMALKVFDRIGVMPATRNEDPVIIGQIVRKSGYSTKIVSFMIAWHLNTNVL